MFTLVTHSSDAASPYLPSGKPMGRKGGKKMSKWLHCFKDFKFRFNFGDTVSILTVHVIFFEVLPYSSKVLRLSRREG